MKTLLKPWPSFTTNCLLFMKKVISTWFYHYFYFCCQTSKPESAALSNDSFFCSQVPKVLATLQNLHTLCCKHFKIFQRIPSPPCHPQRRNDCSVWSKLHPAHYCFCYFPCNQSGTGYESLMWQCSVREKIRRITPFWTSGTNQDNQDLNIVFFQSLGWK